MKRGEKVILERAPSGLYVIRCQDPPITYVGSAASTIIALSHVVFSDEAKELVPSNDRELALGR